MAPHKRDKCSDVDNIVFRLAEKGISPVLVEGFVAQLVVAHSMKTDDRSFKEFAECFGEEFSRNVEQEKMEITEGFGERN